MSIAIRLEPKLEARLTTLAEKTHRSKSFYVREAIKAYIEEMEDYYLGMAVKSNPGKIYSLEEVESMCGLVSEKKQKK